MQLRGTCSRASGLQSAECEDRIRKRRHHHWVVLTTSIVFKKYLKQLICYISSVIFLLNFTPYITFKCFLLHDFSLSCNGILKFLCSRWCVTLLLEMCIVLLRARTFYKLLAFLLASFCTGFLVLWFVFWKVDTWCNKVTLTLTWISGNST